MAEAPCQVCRRGSLLYSTFRQNRCILPGDADAASPELHLLLQDPSHLVLQKTNKPSKNTCLHDQDTVLGRLGYWGYDQNRER